MKKHLILIGLAISSIAFVSCEDELTNNPYSSLSQDALLSSPEGFENAIRGIYAGFIDNNAATDQLNDYYGSDMFAVPDVLSDNLILNQNGRQTKQTLYDWAYNSNGYSGFDLYGDAYKIIRKSNAVINEIDRLDNGAFKDDILGQALTARALAHFDLVRTYGQIPTQSAAANASLGVAYVTTVDPDQKPSRDTVGDVYINIINDLTVAEGLIGATGINSFSKNTVNGILSRVYLYMGEWQASVTAANKVTGTVASIANFPNVWTDASADGVVTQFAISNDDGVAIGTEYSQTSPTNGVRSEYNIAFDFFQLFQTNDVRRDAYISTSVFGGVNYNHIAKYFGKTGQVNNIVNSKILRMAEVMLNKAEAYSEIPGNNAEALAALDAVRSQRYTGFVSGGESGPALQDAIALERRLELAFEGHRFYDLKRKGESIVRDASFGDVADGTGVAPIFSTLTAGSFKFQLPIPQDAINANTSLQQNPDY